MYCWNSDYTADIHNSQLYDINSFMPSWFLIFIIFNHPFLIAKEFEKIPRDGIRIDQWKTLFMTWLQNML
jgi:hypothetical protein